MKQLVPLAVAGLLVAASSSAMAAVFYGNSDVESFFMASGNLPSQGLFVSSYSTGSTTATIANQTISFGATAVTLPEQTYTGTTTLLDPNTLQSKSYSYTFTTSAVNLVLPATSAAALTSSGGGLSWSTSEQEPAFSYLLSGTVTVTGPTESFTGTFSNLLHVNDLQNMGSLTVNGDGSLTVNSSRFYDFGANAPTSIVNRTIDGINVKITAENFPNYMQSQNNSTVYAVPEASAASLALLGGAALLRRRRAR